MEREMGITCNKDPLAGIETADVVVMKHVKTLKMSCLTGVIAPVLFICIYVYSKDVCTQPRYCTQKKRQEKGALKITPLIEVKRPVCWVQ